MKIIRFAALFLALAAGPAVAQEDLVPTPREAAELAAAPIPSANSGAALTQSDVAAFSDGMLPVALAQGDIAGAVVVVVKDGKILFSKGYGVSDTKTRAPVNPARTLFRPGSVSKLFTWTAVMQLVGEGKLDLDADINRYLDFTIPPAFGKPITLRNLMTHTGGFEETLRPLLLGNPDSLEPLDSVLKNGIPARIFPPGEVPAYSNYGATLAGYIVQRVSGEKFTDYIQHHIFTPLGMKHASFVQPLPKELIGDMSKGYQLASGPETPFEMISMGPAGGLSASGEDLGRFMIAHLANGQGILSPELAVRMHGVAFRPFSALLPMAYGFYHDDMNGHPIIAHGGDTGVFHSDLHLVLDANTGVFISINSSGAGRATGILRRGFMRGFMNRYFPAPAVAPLPTLKTAAADGQRVAGDYIVSRRSESNFLAIGNALQPLSVSVNPDATISVSLLVDAAGNTKRWREVRPFIWQDVNGPDLVQANFRDGHVDQIGSDYIGPIVVIQPAGFTTAPWNLYLYAATLIILTLAVAFWPIKAILRWRYERPLALVGRARLLYRLTRVEALIDIAFLAGFPLGLLILTGSLASHSPNTDWIWRGLQFLGVIGILGTVIPVLNFVTALRDPARPWWTKASDGLIVLAAFATIWFAFADNLLTLGLRY